jgi:ATP/maltotriose-dependent transcriptional regulator MalT
MAPEKIFRVLGMTLILEEWVLRRILTTKEKILIYLLENRSSTDDHDAPEEITQTGIAEGIGILPSHFRQYMKPLLEEELVEERSSRISGGKRKRKVYSLKKEGLAGAATVKDSLLSEEIRYFDLDGRTSEGKISEIVESAGNVSLVQLVDELEVSEVLDPTLLKRRATRRETRIADFSRTSPVPERFCGREMERKSILTGIERGKVVVIQGIAGIGKTALASKVCSEVKKKRSVFWYEFRKWHSLWGLLSELSRFLEAMGARSLSKYLRAEKDLDMDKVRSSLRDDLDAGRAVMFFDDFQKANDESVDFFRQLFPVFKEKKELAIVVMTREAAPFYDRKEVDVDHTVEEFQLLGLDKMSSKDVLGEATDEFGMFDEIYTATQGHPLFLELIASVPTIGPEPRLRYVDQFIEEEIYSELKPEEKQMMKIASVYENPVQISRLLFDENMGIETYLALKKRMLVMTLEDGRVKVHEMIRKPFLSMLTPQEKDRYHIWASEGLLREENEILQIEGIHHLLVSGNHSWAARYLKDIGEGLIKGGFVDEMLALIMEFDPRTLNDEEKAVITEREGDIFRTKGQLDDAVVKFEESRRFHEEVGDDQGAARCGRKIGSILRSIGEFEKGLKTYLKALSTIGKDSETMEAARILGGIGSIMARKGKFEKAVGYLMKDLEIARKESDEEEIAHVLNQLGYVLYEVGAHDSALELQKLSLKTKERILEEWKKYSEL